jgi:hypothetical protein
VVSTQVSEEYRTDGQKSIIRPKTATRARGAIG